MYIVAPYDAMISAGDVAVRPVVVEYDDVLSLNCTTSGGPDNTFSWFKGDILLQESADNNILAITAINAADGGLYKCVVNNMAGNSSVNITIYGKPCISFNALREICFI